MSAASRGMDAASAEGQATVLGFTADDVVLATFSYPDLTQAQEDAVLRYADFLDSFVAAEHMGFVAMSPPRQMTVAAVSDSLTELQLQLAGPNSHEVAGQLRDAAKAVAAKTADPQQVENVRLSADSLARITFERLRETSSRKGSARWTSPSSTFF